MPDGITFQFYAPMPNVGPQLASQRILGTDINCVITTTRSHGFESAQIGFSWRAGSLDQIGWLPKPLDAYVDFGHVTVSDGAAMLFQGRASKAPKIVGGRIMGFTAAGYWDALNDGYYYSDDDTVSTSDTVIRDILLQSIGYVSIDEQNWTMLDVVHAKSDFNGQRPGAAIQTMLNEGSGTPCDLQFWDGPNGTVVASLRDRTAPEIPRYRMPWVPDTNVVGVTYDPQQLFGHVQTIYTPDGGTETATDWAPDGGTLLVDHSFADIWRVDRALQISGGQLTAAGAVQLRDTTYAVQSQRQWGGTIRCSALHPLQSIDGATVTRSHVRAGEWLILDGLTDDADSQNVLLQIQQTQYDVMGDTLQLTVSQGMTLRSLDQRITETMDATRSGRNAVSGAKAS